MLCFGLKLGNFFHTREELYSSHSAFCTTWRLKHGRNADFCGLNLYVSYFDSLTLLFVVCMAQPVSIQSTENSIPLLLEIPYVVKIIPYSGCISIVFVH